MQAHVFNSELWLPVLPEELFPFFSDAENLNTITPPWLHFRIITPTPLQIRCGSLIDYHLRVHGLPMRWRTHIKVWEPPHYFIDEQLRGPYRLWIHEHRFEPLNGGTLVRDQVHYKVPFNWVLHRRFVRPDIERIFQFRSEALQKRFNPKNRKCDSKN